MVSSSNDKSSKAWRELFCKHRDILQNIDEQGYCEIGADIIKEVREPRLMTKHDFRDGVPAPLMQKHLNVLSISRNTYLLGQFDVFQKFPDSRPSRPEFCTLPPFETLTVDDITSESKAINALVISGALEQFLDTPQLTETFNGRMGTGAFDFSINLRSHAPLRITVNSAQLEIDAGFENDECIVIMEAKNVLHDDFNVRQLYYPFRKYRSSVTKPIRLVFSQYNNLMYTLYEYEFANEGDFNSIQLLNSASYAFDDCRITADDVMAIWQNTPVLYDDNRRKIDGEPPFPQADKIERIFGLLEFLKAQPEHTATTADIAEYMGTVYRQASYYPAAGEYLGLFVRSPNSTKLSPVGLALINKDRRGRLLEMAKLIFKHEIFHRLYGEAVLKYGDVPPRDSIMQAMTDIQVLDDTKESMLKRRSSTVGAWLRWLLELPDDE